MLDCVVDKLEYEPIPIGSDNDPQRALAEFTGDITGDSTKKIVHRVFSCFSLAKS